MKKAFLLIAFLLFSIIVTLWPFLKELVSSIYLKYILLFCSVLTTLFADVYEKYKSHWRWITLKIITAFFFVLGIYFLYRDDETNANNFNILLSKSEGIFKAQSDSFQENNDKLESILKNIKSFQERQSNPLPDSCYIMFDLVIDYSNLDVKSQIVNKKFIKVEGKDSIFSFNFSKGSNIVLRYIDETFKSIVLTFGNKTSKIKYYTKYSHSPFVQKMYCNQNNEIIFRYNLVPAAGFEGSDDYLDLKLIKSSSHNFISTLDFENCVVKMCFGHLYYDNSALGLRKIKAKIANAKVLLDFNGVDFVTIRKMQQIRNEPLHFSGTTGELTINTLKDDCLSPFYLNNLEKRGGK